MYLDKRVNDLGQSGYVLYNDSLYSAVLINPIMPLGQDPTDRGNSIRLDILALNLSLEYSKLADGVVYLLPEIDAPQPDGNKLPPDMVRIPDKPDKHRLPLRTPWNPDRIPIKKDSPKKKRIH